jgi:hypothetical protein
MRGWTPAQRATFWVGVALVAAGLCHGIVFLLDDQPWAGPVGWRKPTTFGLSFGVTLLSFAVLARWVPLRRREEWWVLGTLSVASVLEVVLIALQAWRDEPSHFNIATPLDAAIWVGMGIGIAGVVVATIWFAAAAFRPLTVRPAFGLAIRSGLVLLLGGYVVGGLIIGNGGGATLTPTGDESILGDAGELKVPHALGLHALQAVPLVGWLAVRLTDSEQWQRRLVLVAIAVWSALLLAQALLALSGRAPL